MVNNRNWRRERDSNPRNSLTELNGLANRLCIDGGWPYTIDINTLYDSLKREMREQEWNTRIAVAQRVAQGKTK